MDYVIPSLAELLGRFRSCFRLEAFATFQHVVAAWLVCPGPRRLTEVFQASALTGRHFSVIYHLFARAAWRWHELGAALLLLLIDQFAPRGALWLVVDDTLCHKRGAKVAFGGIFLDPVLSSKSRKALRFAVNYVVLGLAVRLPFRPDRCFCLPVLWRVFIKKGAPGHKKRTLLAAEMARQAATLLPGRDVWLVGDSAYVNAATLGDRPANLNVLGPIHPKAALYEPAPAAAPGRRGRRRKKGARLATPRDMFADTTRYPAVEAEYDFPGGRRRLRVQVVSDVLWYTAAKSQPVQLVLVRDVEGKWRDLALVTTRVGMSAAEAVEGYCRRWSVELAFHDSKQYLGLADPRVRGARSVERAHAVAFFCYSLSLLWYAKNKDRARAPVRERPWYRRAVRPAFPEMLGALRLALWQGRFFGLAGAEPRPPTREMLDDLLNCLATVR